MTDRRLVSLCDKHAHSSIGMRLATHNRFTRAFPTALATTSLLAWVTVAAWSDGGVLVIPRRCISPSLCWLYEVRRSRLRNAHMRSRADVRSGALNTATASCERHVRRVSKSDMSISQSAASYFL